MLVSDVYKLTVSDCFDGVDTLLKHIKISTLPDQAQYSLNAMVGYKGRVDRVAPGDINIWKSLEYTAVNTVVANPGPDAPSGAGAHPDDASMSAASVASAASSAATATANTTFNQTNLHYMVHLGDFLSVEHILRKASIELLDVILRYDTSEQIWVDILNQLEVDVRDAYRSALSNPVTANLFRHCGNIFMCGPSEAGMVTTSFLAMLPKPPVHSPGGPASPTKRGTAGKSAASMRSVGSPTGAGRRSPTRGGSPSKSRLGTRGASGAQTPSGGDEDVRVIGDEDVEDEILPVDNLLPMVGNFVRLEKEQLFAAIEHHTAAQEELRLLITSAVVRIARRVHYAYMRQLYDMTHYDAFVEQDEHDEAIHRKIILLRRKLQRQRILLEHLTKTFKRMKKDFGVESNACRKIAQRCQDLRNDLSESETELRELLADSLLGGTYKAPIGGVVVNLKSLLFVVLENGFSWLNKEGQMQDIPLTTREVALSPELLGDIESGLFGFAVGAKGKGRLKSKPTPNNDDAVIAIDPTAAYGGAKAAKTDPKTLVGLPPGVAAGMHKEVGSGANEAAELKVANVENLRTVLCLSPVMLVSDSNIAQDPTVEYSLDMPQMFHFSALDTKRLFQLLSHWQVADLRRSCLVAAACNVAGNSGISSFSADGWICHTETLYEALITATKGHDHHVEASLENFSDEMRAELLQLADSETLSREWHGKDCVGRSMIRQITVGSMTQTRRNMGLRSGMNRPMNPKNMSCIDMTAEVTSIYSSICVRRGVFELSTHTLPPGVHGESAKINLALLKDGYTRSTVNPKYDGALANKRTTTTIITIGPVIGRVTPTSAIVLMEFANLLPPYSRKNPNGGGNCNYIELVATDAITGIEYSASASFLPVQQNPSGPGGAPTFSLLFVFEDLVPFRPYDLRISSDELILINPLMVSSASNFNSDEEDDRGVGAVILGTFCTPALSASPATVFLASLAADAGDLGGSDVPSAGERLGDAGAVQDMALYTGEEVALMKNLRAVANDRQNGADTERIVNNGPVGGGMGNTSGVINSSDSTGYFFRILVIGANRPNWLPDNFVDGTDVGAGVGDTDISLGQQRQFLEDSITLASSVNNLLNVSSYNPVDLVMHVGCSNVDLSLTLSEAINLLSKAEELTYNNKYYSVLNHTQNTANTCGVGTVSNYNSNVDKLLLQASEQIRYAYNLHWGSNPQMRSNLSHNSHMFVSSPMIELVTVLNSTSVRSACRELSPYVSTKLLNLITEADHEFQQRLWQSPDSDIMSLLGVNGGAGAGAGASGALNGNGNNASFVNSNLQNCDYIQYVGDGSVVLFILKLRIVPNAADATRSKPGGRDTVGNTYGNAHGLDDSQCLIGNDQLAMLETLLIEKGHLIQTLVIVSPLPVFNEMNSSSFCKKKGTQDSGYKNSYLFTANFGMGSGTTPINYNTMDVTRLLDAVFNWKTRVIEDKLTADQTGHARVDGVPEVVLICGGEGVGLVTTIQCSVPIAPINPEVGGGMGMDIPLSTYSDPIMGAPPQDSRPVQEPGEEDMDAEGGEVLNVVEQHRPGVAAYVPGLPHQNEPPPPAPAVQHKMFSLKVQQLCIGSFISLPGEGVDDIIYSAAAEQVLNNKGHSSGSVSANGSMNQAPSTKSSVLLPGISHWQCVSPYTNAQYNFHHTGINYRPHCALVEIKHPLPPTSQRPQTNQNHNVNASTMTDWGHHQPPQANVSLIDRASAVLQRELCPVQSQHHRSAALLPTTQPGMVPSLAGGYAHHQGTRGHTDHGHIDAHNSASTRIALLDNSAVEAVATAVETHIPPEVLGIWRNVLDLLGHSDDQLVFVAEQSGFADSASYIFAPRKAPGTAESDEDDASQRSAGTANSKPATAAAVAPVEEPLPVLFFTSRGKIKELMHNALSSGDIRIIVLVLRQFCRQNASVFEECHYKYRHNEFGLVRSNSITTALSIISNILQWLINHLPTDVISMIPYPSSFVIRLLWLKYHSLYAGIAVGVNTKEEASVDGGESQASAGGESSAGGSAAGGHPTHSSHNPTRSEDILGSMFTADKAYFMKFCMQCFESSAVLEHFAFTDGLCDGWF